MAAAAPRPLYSRCTSTPVVVTAQSGSSALSARESQSVIDLRGGRVPVRSPPGGSRAGVSSASLQPRSYCRNTRNRSLHQRSEHRRTNPTASCWRSCAAAACRQAGLPPMQPQAGRTVPLQRSPRATGFESSSGSTSRGPMKEIEIVQARGFAKAAFADRRQSTSYYCFTQENNTDCRMLPVGISISGA